MWQEAEAQAVEVARRQAKVREGTAHPDMAFKLEAAGSKLQDMKSNVATLGKEAAGPMHAVDAQQQSLTLQRLTAMMMPEHQRIEAPPAPSMDSMPAPPSYEEVNGVPTSPVQNGSTGGMG